MRKGASSVTGGMWIDIYVSLIIFYVCLSYLYIGECDMILSVTYYFRILRQEYV